jgi:hypothetical protein
MSTIPINVTLSGQYEFELINSSTRQVIDTWRSNNIITDDGMNAMGSSLVGEEFVFEYFQMGEGSTPVSSSDTGLVAPIAGRTNTSDESTTYVTGSDATGSFWETTISRIFYEAEANGNITEVGAFTLSSGGRLASRALIRDVSGSTTTISKTSDNQLRVRYKFRMYLPSTDISGTLFMAGNNYDYVVRPQGILSEYIWGYFPRFFGPTRSGGHFYEFTRGKWTTQLLSAIASPSGALVDPTGTISQGGTTSQCSSVNLLGYVDNTFYRDVEFVFNPSVANFGTTGIRSIKIQPIAAANLNSTLGDATYQMSFTPPVPKTNLNTLTLRFRFGWGRSKIYE